MSSYPDSNEYFDPDIQYTESGSRRNPDYASHPGNGRDDDFGYDEEEFRRNQQRRRERQQRSGSSNRRSARASRDADDAAASERRVADSRAASHSSAGSRTRRPASTEERINRPGRQQRETDPDAPSFIERVVNFFTDNRMRYFLGIVVVLTAVYLAVVGLSYIKHNKADQSAVASQTTEQVIASGDTVENVGGPGGAEVANHLFLEGLGIGSAVLIIYMFVLALALFGIRRINFWSTTFKAIIVAITISMVAGLFTLNSAAPLPLGGYHGRYLNLYLIDHIGRLGAGMVNLALVATVVVLYLAQIVGLYNKYRERLSIIRAKRELRREREAYVQTQVRENLDNNLMNQQDGAAEKLAEADSVAAVSETSSETAATGESGQTVTDTSLEDIDSLAYESDVIMGNSLEPDKSGPIHHDGISLAEPSPSIVDAVTTDAAAAIAEVSSISEFTIEDASDDTATSATATSATDPDALPEPAFDVTTSTIEQGTENTAYEAQGPYDPRADLAQYKMPTLSLLHDYGSQDGSVDNDEQEGNKQRITKVLSDYGIEITKIQAIVGPTVTLYKIVPAEGVRVAKIKRLEDDIAMSLAAVGIRIIAPIPGENNIGIEVPNKEPQTVSIRSILGSKAYQECKYQLPMAMGATINNQVYIADLAKMPHLLVAGATGQGKSVGLNTIIASLIYKRHPSELKFVLVDPKMVEFSLYSRLENHYLAKIPDMEDAVITDWTKVVDTLNSLCVEMDHRYALLKDAECRSITEYNEKFIHRRLNPEKGHRYLPYIVMIVDEFADLIMMAGKSVETPIARIAQKARAVGMHLIIATQRPSTNVITGMIKANFPGRFAFAVRQRVDSQTILDCPGANQLIGRGDMLISTGGPLVRVQCAFIDTDEVEALCHYIDDQQGFPTAYILPDPPTEAGDGGAASVSLTDRDALFEEVARFCVQGTTASTSNVQRKFSIGFVRAGKIMDQLEAAGIVGPATGGKPRQVLSTPEEVEMFLTTL